MAEDERRVAQAVGGQIEPHLKPFVEFLGDFNAESDRGAVLSSAAYIDDLLGQTIAAFLVEGAQTKDLVGEYPGPLSGFSARIMAAHALGLISTMERDECNLIRKVRNEFAHAVKMSFANTKAESLCGGLKLSVGPVEGVKPNTRMRYQTAAVAMILRLTSRPHHVGQAKLKQQNWAF
jgi:mannitol operon repressor